MKRKLVATLVALAALAIMLAPSGAMASSASNPLRLGVVVLQPAMACALLTKPNEMVWGLARFKLDATLDKFNVAQVGHVLGINARWHIRASCAIPGVVLKSVGFKHMSVTSAIDKAILARTSPSARFLFSYYNDDLAKKAIYIGKQQGGESGTTPDTKPLATALCSLIVGQGSGDMVSG